MEILGIDNIFSQVGNLEEAIRFYESLGFILKFKIPRLNAALFNIGNEEPGLMLFENNESKPSRFWVEVKSALEAKQALGKGSLIETATGLTFEILDPWGNTIGFADYSKKQELSRNAKSPLIRPLIETDIPKIVSRYSFPWSTPEKTKALWGTYYQEQEGKIRTVAIIEINGEILGYGSLLKKPECPFFAQKNIPEINAIWIDENHRKKGLGTALVKWLENLASQEGYQQIGIGVGLYKDYGPAQKLYFELGYSPEGNGITYKGETTTPGQSYPLDDDLILWLTKDLITGKVHEESVEFYFKHVKPSQGTLLRQWFQQAHIKEWMHGIGLQNTLNGLEKFFEGKSDTTYWIGYDKDIPFAFLITSPEGKDAITLDLFICDLNYLGKGIAVPMIKEFLRSHFSHMTRVLIDPEATNTRAIHVYQKVGFKIVGEFIASWHPVPHYQMELLMKNLLPSTGNSNA